MERVTLAVGADPERLAWALDQARAAMAQAGRALDAVSFGAYLTVSCHPDRDVARELVRGSVAAFAHFSSMPGSTGAGLAEQDRAVVAEVGRSYDSNLHLVNTAPHASAMPADVRRPVRRRGPARRSACGGWRSSSPRARAVRAHRPVLRCRPGRGEAIDRAARPRGRPGVPLSCVSDQVRSKRRVARQRGMATAAGARIQSGRWSHQSAVISPGTGTPMARMAR